MNKYEFVYIIDAHAPQGTKDEITRQVGDAAAKSDVKIINSQIWLERHRMSFPIGKVSDGTYYLLNIEAPAPSVNKLQALLKLNEQVLRFLAIRRDQKTA